MNSEYQKIVDEIEQKGAQVLKLNDECAEKIKELTGTSNSRILPYGVKEKLNSTIDSYTKKIASLLLDIEELEEVKKILDNKGIN